MEPITLKKPDYETRIFFALAMIIIIAKCSSCSIIAGMPLKPAQFPLTCVASEIAYEGLGKKYFYTFVDVRNRTYYQSDDRILELGKKYTYEELVEQKDQIDRSTTFNAIKND